MSATVSGLEERTSWGTENREATVRLSNSASPSSRQFEMRYVDGTANPYLALAGILGVGHLGIRSNFELGISDCPGPKTAAQMSEESVALSGSLKGCPLASTKRRIFFASDTELSKVLGTEFGERHLSVNKVRCSTFVCDEVIPSSLIV